MQNQDQLPLVQQQWHLKKEHVVPFSWFPWKDFDFLFSLTLPSPHQSYYYLLTCIWRYYTHEHRGDWDPTLKIWSRSTESTSHWAPSIMKGCIQCGPLPGRTFTAGVLCLSWCFSPGPLPHHVMLPGFPHAQPPSDFSAHSPMYQPPICHFSLFLANWIHLPSCSFPRPWILLSTGLCTISAGVSTAAQTITAWDWTDNFESCSDLSPKLALSFSTFWWSIFYCFCNYQNKTWGLCAPSAGNSTNMNMGCSGFAHRGWFHLRQFSFL